MAANMNKTKEFTVNDTLQPAEIITQHIRKIMESEDIDHYAADIEKLEDLLCTEIDKEYEDDEKDIKKEVNALVVLPQSRGGGRDAYNDFLTYKNAKKEQYRKRLTFRALVKLAKRKGLWLMDEEKAVISHYDAHKLLWPEDSTKNNGSSEQK